MAYTRKICGRQKLPGKKTLHAFKLSGRQWKKVRIYRNCFLGEQRACVKMCTWMRENPFFSLGEMPISYTVEKIALWLVWGLVWCVCERKLCACGIYMYVLVDFIVRAIWHVDVCMCVCIYVCLCVYMRATRKNKSLCWCAYANVCCPRTHSNILCVSYRLYLRAHTRIIFWHFFLLVFLSLARIDCCCYWAVSVSLKWLFVYWWLWFSYMRYHSGI